MVEFAKVIINVLRKINRSFANKIIIESNRVLEQGELSRYLQKIYVANLYVDTELFREVLPLSMRKPVVGFIGRLSAEKGIMSFITAIKMLNGNGYKFKIVGDGPLRGEVEAILKSQDMTHVEYFGWLPNEDVSQFMNEIKLLVLPSSGEGMPNILLEAMACSTPVLASPVGGIPDLVIPQETGFLLPDNEPETLMTMIISVMEDPNLVNISQNAKRLVKDNYSLAASIKKWKEIFDDTN